MKIKITKKGRAVQIPVHFVVPIPPEAPEQPKVATPEEVPPETSTSATPAPEEAPAEKSASSRVATQPPEPAEPSKSKAKKKRGRKSHAKSSKHPHRRFAIKPWVAYPLAAVFVALLVFSGCKIVRWIQDNQNSAAQQEETNDDAAGREVSSEGEIINPPEEKTDDYWYYIGLPFYEVDFAELMAKNPDTVAFIHMNNNNVNYPVVQTTDNDYYLSHAFDGSYNDAGWVFMDYRSSADLPNSDNTVIYGHGRLNGTVFGSLQSALTPEWQANRDNYAIWLSTPTENRLYQIFSIYAIQAENYYLKQNFATIDEKATWVNTMNERDITPSTSVAIPSDNVLTLSTCKDNAGTRIVVQAKLIKRQAR